MSTQFLSQNDTGAPARLYDGITTGSVLRVWWFYRRFIIVVTAIVMIVAILTIGSQQKLFTAFALIKIHYAPQDLVKKGRPNDQDQRDNPIIANSIIYMSSPSFLNMVAEEEGLYSDLEFRPRQSVSSSDKVESQGDGEHSMVSGMVVDALAERLVVAQRGGSHVISVEATSADPSKAARIANTAVEIFTKTELARLEDLEKSSLDWLDRAIKSSRGELVSLEGKALELASKHGLYDLREDPDPNITQGNSVQWAELTAQLAKLKAERAIIKSRYENLLSFAEKRGAESALAIVKSPILDELRNLETITARRLSQLSQDLGNKHPTIINLRNDMSLLRQKMINEVQNILHSTKDDLIVNGAREAEIESKISTLKKKTLEQKSGRLEIQEIDRTIDRKTAELNILINKQMQIKEQQMIRQGLADIMSPATIPVRHRYPKIWPLIAYIGFGVMSLCLLGIFLRDRWISDFGFTSQADVRALSMNPIGLVPELSKSLSRGDTIEDHIVTQPYSVHAEAIQRVRNHLFKLRSEDPCSATVVSIVSSSPDEGKTTIAITLARQTASTGSKVLLIDGNVRHPDAPQRLGVKVRDGLCELLSDDRESRPRIEKDTLTDLHILQAGNPSGSSANLFSSKQMNALMRELGNHYDWIYFDSPAINGVVDGIILSKHADFVIYVARWLETTRRVVQTGINQLRDMGITSVGIALTRVDMDAYQKYEDLEELSYYGYASVGGLQRIFH